MGDLTDTEQESKLELEQKALASGGLPSFPFAGCPLPSMLWAPDGALALPEGYVSDLILMRGMLLLFLFDGWLCISVCCQRSERHKGL